MASRTTAPTPTKTTPTTKTTPAKAVVAPSALKLQVSAFVKARSKSKSKSNVESDVNSSAALLAALQEPTAEAQFRSLLFRQHIETMTQAWAILVRDENMELISLFTLFGFPINNIFGETEQTERTALIHACIVGNETMVQFLLQQPLIEVHKWCDFPAIVYAVEHNHTNIVQLLLLHPNIKKSFDNVLTRAIWKQKENTVRFLLEQGMLAHEANVGRPPLVAAVSEGQVNIVRLLLEHGADCNQADAAGWTALFVACVEGEQEEIVRLLLDHGADREMVNNNNEKAIDVATSKNIQYILKNYFPITSYVLK